MSGYEVGSCGFLDWPWVFRLLLLEGPPSVRLRSFGNVLWLYLQRGHRVSGSLRLVPFEPSFAFPDCVL